VITWTLGLLFPPKLGKIEDVDSVLLRYRLASGELETIDPGPPEGGIAKVLEWRDGRWFPLTDSLRGIRKESSKEITGQLQPSHPRVGDGSCIPGSRLLWVRPA
jgi:hypothetical protein